MNLVSETAQIQEHAKLNAPKKIKLVNIARLNREYYKAY